MELLMMKPVFKEAIWGERSLGTAFIMRFPVLRQGNAGRSAVIKAEREVFLAEPMTG